MMLSLSFYHPCSADPFAVEPLLHFFFLRRRGVSLPLNFPVAGPTSGIDKDGVSFETHFQALDSCLEDSNSGLSYIQNTYLFSVVKNKTFGTYCAFLKGEER